MTLPTTLGELMMDSGWIEAKDRAKIEAICARAGMPIVQWVHLLGYPAVEDFPDPMKRDENWQLARFLTNRKFNQGDGVYVDHEGFPWDTQIVWRLPSLFRKLVGDARRWYKGVEVGTYGPMGSKIWSREQYGIPKIGIANTTMIMEAAGFDWFGVSCYCTQPSTTTTDQRLPESQSRPDFIWNMLAKINGSRLSLPKQGRFIFGRARKIPEIVAFFQPVFRPANTNDPFHMKPLDETTIIDWTRTATLSGITRFVWWQDRPTTPEAYDAALAQLEEMLTIMAREIKEVTPR